MRGIRLGGYHTYDDFGLILKTKEIGTPSIKTRKIDIEGADGALDMTDYFGGAKYEDVTHKFTFEFYGNQQQLINTFSTIKNAVHGRKLRVSFDDEPAYYYMGRCNVSAFTNEKNIGHVEIETVCEPYKYKLRQTVVTQAISGVGEVTLTNARKRAVPQITASAAFTLGFNGSSFSRAAGTYTIPEIELAEGANTVTVAGTGTISFAWQEGEL